MTIIQVQVAFLTLLGDKDKCVWTTCPELLPDSSQTPVRMFNALTTTGTPLSHMLVI